MDEMLRCFAENGYAVVQGALSPEEVAAINDGIDMPMWPRTRRNGSLGRVRGT